MASLKLQHRRYWASVRIPKPLRDTHNGKQHLYRNLQTSDLKIARREAAAWEAMLRMEWLAAEANDASAPTSFRTIYSALREAAESGGFKLYGNDDADPAEAGIGYEIDKMADAIGERDLTDAESARLAALQDALLISQRQPVPRRVELELSFRELADEFLKLWRTQQGLKETNTEQQKVATFDLFAGFWGNAPIRDVKKKDAAAFIDALRQMDPLWARSPKSKDMTWAQLQATFGGRKRGLSDATINRHMATLKSLWAWAQERDHCEGNNPFSGFHRQLREGKNVKGYVAWEKGELQALFKSPPKRADLTEVMLVAMFSGMRLDEIASLTWDRIRTEEGVTFLHIEDAKTPAGNRRVPLHPSLTWLSARKRKRTGGRVWAGFNEEGPGKKAGADAGKEFSRFKLAAGFDDRRKAFHSFRKNFVGQLEEKGVPENEVAQIVGHEKGFTFGKYGGGISLARMAEIVAKIDYPDVKLPLPRG